MAFDGALRLGRQHLPRALARERNRLSSVVSIAHDLGRGACRIKHLADAYSLIRHHYRNVAWTEFFRQREREGTAIVCLNVLDLLTRYFELLQMRGRRSESWRT